MLACSRKGLGYCVVKTRPVILVSFIFTSKELRDQYLQFFSNKNHIIIPGSSVIPKDDPSLLFVNAGMNQFKKYYLGQASPYFVYF